MVFLLANMMRRNGKQRRIKIGIRPQLIILVCFLSLFSLLILGMVAGIYTAKNISSLRSDRLKVISQLKATQVVQSIEYIYYQVYWLSQREEITSPLALYKAGNMSSLVFSAAQQLLDLFLLLSETFALAKIYDLSLSTVVLSKNSGISVASSVAAALYPLGLYLSVPTAVTSSNLSFVLTEGLFTGPLANSSTSDNTTYYFGLTIPIYSNISIILNTPSVSGYLTVVADAKTLQESLTAKGADYNVAAIKGVYANSSHVRSADALSGFELVFPVALSQFEPSIFYPSTAAETVAQALTHESGFYNNLEFLHGQVSAVGYYRVRIDEDNMWSILVDQRRSSFLAPVHKLTQIIVGVVIGVGVFMCLLTFPLAVWFVTPITKLKEATEAITKSKKEKDNQAHGLMRLPLGRSTLTVLGKTTSGTTGVTVSSGSSTVYLSGIRLPSRIPKLKKLFKDELTELLDAFNIMTQELETQYTHLEQRVKLRTKELEAAKIEAEAANEAKTVFIANISHELRTPLNGILGMTSIALEERDHLQVQDLLKLIHRLGELLLHILTELLTYSKNTLNRSKLEKSNFQILEIVHQVRSIFGKLAVDQRVNFKVLVKPNAMRKLILFGDSNRIIQVVMNLVSNSLKFTPVDGNVDVTFRLVGEYDEEASQAIDYLRVCTKSPPPGLEDPLAEETIPPVHTRTTSNVPSHAPENDADSYSINSTPADHSDLHSLVTLATSEFEKVLFTSQFSNNKPLPPPPTSRRTLSLAEEKRNERNGGKGRPAEDGKIDPRQTETHGLEAGDPVADAQAGYIADNKEEVNKTKEDAQAKDAARAREAEVPPNRQDPARHNGTESLFASIPESAKRDGSHKLSQHSDDNVASYTNSDSRKLSIGFGGSRADFFNSPHQLLNSELVKDSKVYKMRKLYLPKVWAIQIEVSDTGSGIEPALQEKVFEPFIQGDQTLSRSYGGTGLGLSICRQLAKMMHGTLTLKSTIGKGSSFRFTVPLPQNGEIVVPPERMEDFCNDEFNPNSKVNRRVIFDIDEHNQLDESKSSDKVEEPHADSHFEDKLPEPKAPKSPSKFTGRLNLPKANPCVHHLQDSSTGTVNQINAGDTLLESLSHLKILVAEDNSVNQEVIKRMLRLEGFTNVTMAGNGAEAVDFVQHAYDTDSQFDMIFMDVQMPKMDGLTATRLIRNNLRYSKPIIALTAFADESNVKECLNSGMTGFLSKPIKRTSLRQIITEFSTELLCEIVTTPVGISDELDRRLEFPLSLPNKTR